MNETDSYSFLVSKQAHKYPNSHFLAFLNTGMRVSLPLVGNGIGVAYPSNSSRKPYETTLGMKYEH